MKIFVACAARLGLNEEHKKLAYEVGKYIGENNHELIFGAFDKGLMGQVYFGYMDGSKNPVVHGITKDIWEENFNGLDIKYKTVTSSMQERKQIFFDTCDAMIVLPGGIGTLDEFISCLECNESGEFHKPLIVVNKDNYYTPIFEFLDNLHELELARNARDHFIICDNIDDVKNEISKLN